jgi:hypothetical protein
VSWTEYLAGNAIAGGLSAPPWRIVKIAGMRGSVGAAPPVGGTVVLGDAPALFPGAAGTAAPGRVGDRLDAGRLDAAFRELAALWPLVVLVLVETLVADVDDRVVAAVLECFEPPQPTIGSIPASSSGTTLQRCTPGA